MTDRDATRDQEAELLRMRLHQLVDDVEPRGDALPRLLSATRRRRLPRRRPLLAAGGAAVAATAVFLVALLVFPGGSNRGTEPVSVQPNSYVAESEAGVVSSFDVFSGRRIERVGRVSGAIAAPLVADGQRVYAVVSRGNRYEIVEVSGAQRVISSGVAGAQRTVLAAGGGRVAYLDGEGIEISGAGDRRRIPVPAGREVLDLALAADGHLAVLTVGGPGLNGAPETASVPLEAEPLAADRVSIHVVEPGVVSMTERTELRALGECGPVALAWAGRELAVVQPVDCGFTRVRITTLDRDSGEQIGAGVPFEAGMLRTGQVQLSTDRLGRFLLTASGARQWLVDGTHVLPVPSMCSSGASCGDAPGSFWG